MAKKMRVYEVARDLNISSEALLEMIRALGAQVKSHMSAVDGATVEALHGQFQHEKEKIKEADVLKRERQQKRSKTFAAPVKDATPPPAEAPAADAAAVATAAADESPATAVADKALPGAEVPTAVEAPATGAAVAAAPATDAAESATVTGVQKLATGGAPTAEGAEAARKPKRLAKPRGAKLAPPRPQPHVFRPSQSAIVTGRKPIAAPRRPSAPPSPRGQRPPAVSARRRGPAPPPTPGQGAPPGAPGAPGAPTRRRKDRKKKVFDEKKVRENVRRTMQMIDGRKKPKRKRKTRDSSAVAVEEDRTLRVTEFITLGELADLMEETPSELIGACMNLGVMATINQRLDKDTIITLVDEMGSEVEFITEYGSDQIEEETEAEEHPVERPPVVTVMGHVDHGKTTLLDHIRRTNVVAGEAGSITQHIGAYVVDHHGRKVTFLDTPGHAAFTAMRARGAQATDIVVLVVAADDKVMPQTIEAIDHAKAADVPVVVAINKIDLPGADPEGVKQGLLRHGIVVEELGGNVVSVPISAKQGTNIEQMLDMVLLVADVQEFKADPTVHARGVVLEAKVEQGRGIVGSVLIQRGTARVGDVFICGVHSGKVRALHDEWGENLKQAGPSMPVEILGWDGLPTAGDTFAVLGDERDVTEIAHKRQILAREQQLHRSRPMTLADLHSRMAEGEGIVELNLIVKGDMDGSVQALIEALGQIPADEVKLNFVHSGVGNINESDVLLAGASQAVIIGFHVRTEARASSIAHEKGIDIHQHRIIYEAVETIKKAMEGLLKAEEREVVLGAAEVRQVFKLPKVVVAGCYVTEGKIPRSAAVRIIRGGETMFTGKIDALKRFKDDVRDVASGFECGISLAGFQEVHVKDIIEAYKVEQIARTLG